MRATGIGSWPGTSAREAVRVVRDLLVDGEGVGLPHCPETPARGPGADIIGRAAGLLVDLHVDLQPSGWRFVDRPGRDASRTASLHREDLDELAEAYDGYVGPLKVQVAGPWTLAASLRLNRGERVVADPGAVADLVASLADGIQAYVADVRRLVPGAEVVLQVDEPSLPAVLEGSLPTSSGFGRVRAVDPQVVMRGIESVLAAHDGATAVHCCHPSAPLPLLRATGAGALAIDLTDGDAGPLGVGGGHPRRRHRGLGRAACPPTAPAPTQGARAFVLEGFERSGLGSDALRGLVVSPTCGLAGLTPEGARSVLRTALDTARRLGEEVGS